VLHFSEFKRLQIARARLNASKAAHSGA